MTARRALVIGYHAPQPDRDSGSRRIFHSIEFLLEAGWHVALLAADGVGPLRDARVLERRGVTVYDGTKSDIDAVLADGAVDLALIAFWVNAQRYLPGLRRLSPQTRVVVDSVDLHFLRESRAALRSGDEGGRRMLGTSDGARMAAELNTYAQADAVLTVSRKEADLINDLCSDSTLAQVVPDHEVLEASSVPFEERHGIVSLGSFQHPPNVEAVAWLCQRIVPLIDPKVLEQHPMYIVGNALDDSVRRFGDGLANVHMVGWVPEVEPYLERCRISVVPLLHGAGTKRKLVQALAVGTPSVCTSIAIEGLDLHDGIHVLVADEPGLFAAAIERLLTDEALWTRLAKAGRDQVVGTHGREAARHPFLATVERVLAAPTKRYEAAPAEDRQAEAAASGWDHDAAGRSPAGALARQPLRGQLRQRLERLPQPRRLLPNPLFDAAWYRATYADVAARRMDPYRHWRKHGIAERRDPNAVFETAWYLAQYPDVAASGLDPLEHYWRYGVAEGRDPSPGFATRWYLAHNPDVAASGRHPLLHYLRHGRAEGRPGAPAERGEGQAAQVASGAGAPAAAETAAAPGTRGQPSAPASRLPRVRAVPAVSATAGNGHHRAAGPRPEPPETDVRLIAFYLPQFHPIPENDAWWGKGFTEWRSVAAADPLFPGHYQPHIPADLGFYDLRLAETRQAQADLARAYGIHGFCYYHYWFDSKRLLEQPFDEVLASGKPDLPFCLCWANDPWSRRWDGREDELLQTQSYSHEDDLAHIRSLLAALSDPRAIRVDGKPIFLVYRAKHLPEPRRMTDLWRTEVERAGLPGIYLIAIETAWDLGWDATEAGFDAKVLFQPQFGWLMTHATERGAAFNLPELPQLQVYDYATVRDLVEALEPVTYRRYELVVPGWDNTARVGERAVVLHGSTPKDYELWLSRAVARARKLPADQRLVFVNAWNEWAEGAHLEPDLEHGLGYLEATRRAVVGAVR